MIESGSRVGPKRTIERSVFKIFFCYFACCFSVKILVIAVVIGVAISITFYGCMVIRWTRLYFTLTELNLEKPVLMRHAYAAASLAQPT